MDVDEMEWNLVLRKGGESGGAPSVTLGKRMVNDGSHTDGGEDCSGANTISPQVQLEFHGDWGSSPPSLVAVPALSSPSLFIQDP